MHSIQSNSSGTNWSMVLLVCLYFPTNQSCQIGPQQNSSVQESTNSPCSMGTFFSHWVVSPSNSQHGWHADEFAYAQANPLLWCCMTFSVNLLSSVEVLDMVLFDVSIVWCACMLFWASAHCLWYFTLQYISTTADRQYGLVMMVTNLVYTMALEM